VRSAYEIARADVEIWQTRLAFCRVLAPVPGIVTAKQIERGSAVTSNQALFDIDDDSLLIVRARISELDVVHLEIGRRVPIQLDAYPGTELAGHVRRIFPSADATSRLVPVEVVLDQVPAKVAARPGFLARIEFTVEQRNGVLAVPAAAVGVMDGESFVYVVEAGVLARRPVVIGLTASGWIEIKEGLVANQQVVSSGHVNLRDGLAVRITQESGSGAADD
jgi:membrane fusion protein, multidrug efflux system